MHKLIEYLTNELKTLEQKADREGNLSRSEMECGDLQAHFLKSLLTAEAMMGGGSSYEGNSNGYSGRRDSMGRYADSEYSGRYYDGEGGSSGRSFFDNGYSGRRYSRDEGKSEMMHQLEMMMEKAGTQEEKDIMRQTMNKLKNM